MKKKINDKLELYFTPFYPYKSLKKYTKKFIVTLGIGGNIGDMKMKLHKLFFSLLNDKDIDILQTSPLLKNPPFGYLDQDDFLNAIVVINTNLSPIQLLNLAQRYENRYKRKRSFQDAPRTMDIDIIFIKEGKKNLKIDHKRLIVPHKGWQDRVSVKIPLSYC